MTTPKPTHEPGDLKFEDALERLEKIVQEMEAGQLGLEEMISRFEEGSKLRALCAHRLEEIEKKIEILVKDGDEIKAAPFEPAVEPKEAN